MEIPAYKEVMNELSKRSFQEYVEYSHNGRYVHGKFTRYLTNEIQKFIETKTGNSYDILCLSVPPQHGKSMTITESLPSWLLGHNPDARIIIVSYNLDFSKLFLRRNRDKIVDYGKDIFGLEIGEIDNAEEISIKGRIGSIRAKGIMSGITGNPAEYVIIDDPIKNREEADSEAMRSKLYDEWLNSVKSRLAPASKVIIIQTRWHKQDLIGMINQNEPNVTYINFPVIAEHDNDELNRKIGDTLSPEIGRDKKWWEDFAKSYQNKEGNRALTALYYGRPSNDEGGIFKRSWFMDNLYTELPSVGYKIISVDATFKDTKNSDFVAIQVWGKINEDIYLIEKVKRNMGFVDTVEAIRTIISKYPDYNALYIEDKANGSAIIDVLKRKYRAVIPVNPDGGKESRASAVAPILEAGNVHVRSTDMSLVDEACDFPNSDHDDEVDAMTQALNKLRSIVSRIKIIDEDKWDYDDQVNDILGFR